MVAEMALTGRKKCSQLRRQLPLAVEIADFKAQVETVLFGQTFGIVGSFLVTTRESMKGA